MTKGKGSYVLLCGPSGVGLRGAIEKLRSRSGSFKSVDVEEELCNSGETIAELRKIGIRKPRDAAKWPTMYHVTWHLSRHKVTELWQHALEKSLDDLENSPQEFKVLTCHLIHYCGRREEFFSSFKTNLFSTESFSPSHLVLLIDDVYDMYLRLTGERELFNPETKMSSFWSRIKEDGDISSYGSLDRNINSSLCLEWQLGAMTHLLSWRHLEMLTAENLAMQLGCNFLVWGVKQLTDVLILWLTQSSVPSIYLSHAISRPRRDFRKSNRWPDVVSEFDEMQGFLYKKDLVCVRPSAIDEFRIKKQDMGVNTPKARVPLLEEHWPLPGNLDSVLYTYPGKSQDFNHKTIIAPRIWDFDKRCFIELDIDDTKPSDGADKLLRALERQIGFNISFRDHFFVAACEIIFVFRPLYSTGTVSNGVKAEIRHWKLLAKTNRKKKAVFVHFKEDVVDLINCFSDKKERGDLGKEIDLKKKIDLKKQIDDIRAEIIHEETGLDVGLVKDGLKQIDGIESSNLLDDGPTQPEIAEILKKLPEYTSRARRQWLLDSLLFKDIEGIKGLNEDQIAPWVFDNMKDFRDNIVGIENFIKNGQRPQNPSLEWFDDKLEKCFKDL